MSAGFVAALIEGFEAALDEVLVHDLSAGLAEAVRTLRDQLADAKRTLELMSSARA